MKSLLYIVLASLPLFTACDDMQTIDAIDCPAGRGPFTLQTSRVTGSVTFDPPAAPLSRGDAVIIEGAAHHEDGLAIRDVRIGGVSAEKLGFNYASWRASLSWEQIIGVATIDASGNGVVPVTALDSCGNLYPFAVFRLPVDSDPNLRIDALSVTATYPNDTSTIPANGRGQAVVTIVAEGRAVGARVVVKASAGAFQGYGPQAEVVLTSPFGDASTARAELLFTSTVPGAALITAEVKNVLASAMIVTVAAPTLSPASADIRPGTSLTITAESAAGLVSCLARASEGWLATIDEDPLDLQPMAIPESAIDSQGRVFIVVTAGEFAEDGSSIVLSCEDTHGQVGTARIDTEGAL